MKRLWSTLGLLLPVVYALGRLSGRAQAPHIVVTPPDVHLHTAEHPQSTPVSGPAARRYERLDRHKIMVDPYAISFLSLLATFAAIVFAWQSNELNDAQTKLLERQVAIEAAQALPVFGFGREVDYGSDRLATTDHIVLTNEGGVARDVRLVVTHLAMITWRDKDDQGVVAYIPIEGYYPAPAVFYSNSPSVDSTLWDGSFDPDGLEVGTTDNAVGERRFTELVTGLVEQMGGTRIRVFFSWDLTVEVSYIDYQRNRITELYGIQRASGDDMVQFQMGSDYEDIVMKRYDEAMARGVSIDVRDFIAFEIPQGAVDSAALLLREAESISRATPTP